LPESMLGIDTGGTFTDLVLIANGTLTVHKLPSTPDDPSRAAVDGAASMALDDATRVAYGTTVATNALLERKGATTALVTTAGFEDVIQIGRQARTRLYDLEYHPPEPLIPAELRFGVSERVAADGTAIVPLTDEALADLVRRVTDSGAESVAISLLFSFLHPAHEAALRDALAATGTALFVTASSDLLPEFREFERTSTAVVNAYVGPLMSAYLERLGSLIERPLTVMQSSGGGTSLAVARREPVRTVLSGPAGGVIGATHVAKLAGFDHIITFDMGGTSTDVALCPGRVQTSSNHAVDGMPIGVPVIDIHTVGAGGGSIARVDDGGALRVGPDSAGADPGPACYGRGVESTVTDANLLLGRMMPDRFLGGRMPITSSRAEAAVGALVPVLGVGTRESALGIVRVANAVMERALRNVSLERGFDPREFTLVPFGGAGPQHACELAEALDMRSVLVPRYPGVLSALGVAIADTSKELSRTVMVQDSAAFPSAASALDDLSEQASDEFANEGADRQRITLERAADVRYKGQSFELQVDWPSGATYDAIGGAFHVEHEARFGYADHRGVVEIVNVRVRAVVPAQLPEFPAEPLHPHSPTPVDHAEMWFNDGALMASVYDRDDLTPGAAFDGPSLITQMDATTVLPPGWHASVDSRRNLLLSRGGVA
jgi:N-methylhydantoinase A